MKTLYNFFAFCFVSIVVYGGDQDSKTNTTTSLSFHIVQEEKFDGARYIDVPGFEKLGYISATPDLVLTRLKDGRETTSRVSNYDRSGKQTGPSTNVHDFTIEFYPDDAKKFTALTEKAVRKRILIMVGDTPLIAPVVKEPITTSNVAVSLGGTDKEKIVGELKKLVK